eukprot:6457376-Amphidinium_carterae.3
MLSVRQLIGAAGPDEFERPGLDGRAIFTSTLRAVFPPVTLQRTAQRLFWEAPRTEEGSDLAEDPALRWIVRLSLPL